MYQKRVAVVSAVQDLGNSHEEIVSVSASTDVSDRSALPCHAVSSAVPSGYS